MASHFWCLQYHKSGPVYFYFGSWYHNEGININNVDTWYHIFGLQYHNSGPVYFYFGSRYHNEGITINNVGPWHHIFGVYNITNQVQSISTLVPDITMKVLPLTT